MAQRYGGKYSPEGAANAREAQTTGAPLRGRRPRRAGARLNFLFIVPFIFVVVGFTREPLGLATHLAAFGLLIAAAYMTREGLRAEEAYDARKVAKRPAIPRKLFGSLLTGAGLFLAGYLPEGTLVTPAIFAVLGTVLHAIAFGADPRKDKGAEGVDSFQADRVARVVDEAETHLAAMQDAILRAGDRKLEGRVDRFVATAREMCRRVEEDPRDLTGVRKYLGVYLLGARDATVKFADLYAHNRNAEARSDYEALLDDLEQSFAARTDRMLIDDKSDLDVEIDVLRERLAREGVRTEQEL
ncbi:MAG: 5-bromo-4-chloroindolyl phosphate hydrolysis family protein [Pseudomonadota bacterium]